MVSNYCIYLCTLPIEKRWEQILVLLGFFFVLTILCIFLKFLKTKFLDNNKNSLFQRFLKKL